MTRSKKRNNGRTKRKKRGNRSASASKRSARRCGLCGKSDNLTRTECCGNWICDDEDAYVLFSYARNSCSRNHRRFTLCGHHHVEGHVGDWTECQECREGIETEMYVNFGTNDYNFVKLKNAPSYEPTHCKQCGKVIRLCEESYTLKGGAPYCESCSPVPW